MSDQPRSLDFSRRINLVLLLGAIAVSWQVWSFRGALNHGFHCPDLSELLQDSPITTIPPHTFQQQPNGKRNDGQSTGSQFDASKHLFPLPQRNSTNHTLAVIVLSRRNGFKVRQAIRNTWAKGHDNVFFVIGQGCSIPLLYRGVDEGGNSYCKFKPRPLDDAYVAATMNQIQSEEKLTAQLLQEQAQYQDLLVMPVIDMYRTLPQKLKFAYTFVHYHLPTVQWVLKVDDDFFVRIDPFAKALQTHDASQPILIGGDIRLDHKAHTGGKWKELPQFPHGAIYPPFPLGSYGHVVTRPIVDYVVQYKEALFDYQGEDVSIGIWLKNSLAPETKFLNDRRMSNGGDCRKPNLYVVGHDITPPKMEVCQNVDPDKYGH